MAFTIGNKILDTQEIEVISIIPGGGSIGSNSPATAVYKHINAGGSTRQEMTMTETEFVAAGWQDK